MRDKVNLDKLSELHDRVKTHIYRESGRYKKGYGKLIEAFFGEAIKQISNFCHHNGYRYPFIGHMLNTLSYYFCYDLGNLNDIERVIDNNIGHLHRFIETGDFLSYEDYYDGKNPLNLTRFRIYRLNKKTKNYEICYPKEDVIKIIDAYENKLEKELSGKKDEEKLETYNEFLKFYKRKLKEFK